MLPSKDPWYNAPLGYDSFKPGTVLRVRPVSTPFEHCSGAYDIMFASTGSDYRSSYGVATYFIPSQPSGNALLSYQFPYNSCNIDDRPSYIVTDPDHFQHKPISASILLGLSKGWHVVIADQNGPDALLDGIISGHMVLDSIRAVAKVGMGLVDAPSIALWGFSGGAIACAWAAELQPHYAPELVIAGGCLGGLPPSIAALLEVNNGTPWAGQVAQMLTGVTNLSPEVYDHLLNDMKSEHRAEFQAVRKQRLLDTFAKFAGKDVLGQFSSGRAILDYPPLVRLLARCTLGNHGVPAIPLFLHQAVLDEIIPIVQVDQLVDKWAKLGVAILYERNAVSTHLGEAANSRERAIEVVTLMLDGKFSPKGCEIRDVERSIPGAIATPSFKHIGMNK